VRSIRHEDKLFNPSTPGGVDEAHERQAKKRNKNTAGLDALRQLERGRGNRKKSADGDPGPSRLSQGSARHGGKPTDVTRGTAPLSSKPTYVVATAVKPRPNSSTNKKDKQYMSKRRRRRYFLAERKWKTRKRIGTVERNLKILIRKPTTKPFVIWTRKRVCHNKVIPMLT
jgi:hypothetical protein